MAHLGRPAFLVFALLSLPIFSNCQGPPRTYNCSQGTSITNPQTLANLNRVLSGITAKASATGYAAVSEGPANARAYVLAQCRGDVSTDDCKSCLAAAAQQLPVQCPDRQLADARIWYDYCFLRCSTRNFTGELDTVLMAGYGYTDQVATDPARFEVKLGGLMSRVRAQAVAQGSRGLGKGKSKLSPYVTLYGLAQCTRDLPPIYCAQCVATAVEDFENLCLDSKGCLMIYGSCYVRYDTRPFFFPLSSRSVVGEPAAAKLTFLHP